MGAGEVAGDEDSVTAGSCTRSVSRTCPRTAAATAAGASTQRTTGRTTTSRTATTSGNTSRSGGAVAGRSRGPGRPVAVRVRPRVELRVPGVPGDDSAPHGSLFHLFVGRFQDDLETHCLQFASASVDRMSDVLPVSGDGG